MKNKNVFSDNDLALLMDRKDRRYLVTLESGKTFHSHLGQLPHKDLIDNTVGGWYKTDRGHVLLGIRPSLADYVVEMPRGPQIIYPKDLGTIITLADIFPGATVIEAGLGSGSLTTALLRAVGNTGQVVSYDLNESTVDKALNNIQRVVPDTSNLTIKIGDIYQGINETQVDRIVLDVPEPWQAVKSVGDSLVMGGRFLSFLPTVLQVHELSGQLRDDGRFQMINTIETLLRSWHVSERSVRPDHRMIAHSGFLTTAVRCEPKSTRPVAEQPDEEIQSDNTLELS
jgi:tRNA (adenine57-N1/adenine58-N1)-methyltransferase